MDILPRDLFILFIHDRFPPGSPAPLMGDVFFAQERGLTKLTSLDVYIIIDKGS